jgi:hypothetical protein
MDGFVCAHMLGHLDAEQRARTFTALRSLMTADAVGLVTLPAYAPPDPEAIAAHRELRTLGRYTYVHRYVPHPSGEGYLAEYQVAEGDRVLRTERFAEHWSHPSLSELTEELATAGLQLDLDGSAVGVVRVHRYR